MKAHGDDAMTGRSPVRCAVRSETPSGAAVAENTSPTPDPRTRGEHGTEHAAQAPFAVALTRIEQENGRLLQTQIRLLKDGYAETPLAEREAVIAAKVALVEAAFGRFLDSLAA